MPSATPSLAYGKTIHTNKHQVAHGRYGGLKVQPLTECIFGCPAAHFDEHSGTGLSSSTLWQIVPGSPGARSSRRPSFSCPSAAPSTRSRTRKWHPPTHTLAASSIVHLGNDQPRRRHFLWQPCPARPLPTASSASGPTVSASPSLRLSRPTSLLATGAKRLSRLEFWIPGTTVSACLRPYSIVVHSEMYNNGGRAHDLGTLAMLQFMLAATRGLLVPASFRLAHLRVESSSLGSRACRRCRGRRLVRPALLLTPGITVSVSSWALALECLLTMHR